MASPFVKAQVGNLKGTFAGVIAGAITAYIAKLGYLAAAASYLSLPVDDVTYAAVVVFAGLANYAITNFSQAKALNDLYEALPTTEASYPKDPEPKQHTEYNFNKKA